jgi:ubiquinone/menaquinone biosynthesis C-methylase UbiE
MTETQRAYVPAAGRDWRLPFYDPLVALMGAGHTRQMLIEQAGFQSNQRVLEIGCGTGTLLTLIARQYPGLAAVGLDPDPKALARARTKAARSGVSVQLDQGFADSMPYLAGSFDRVLSSFMFHHIPTPAKLPTLREVRRVLKPGGLFTMLDFGGDVKAGWIARHLHAAHGFEENEESRIIDLMRQAGLVDARRTKRDAVLFGHLPVNYFAATC